MKPLRSRLVVLCLKLANRLLGLACRLALDSEGAVFAATAPEPGGRGTISKLEAGDAA